MSYDTQRALLAAYVIFKNSEGRVAFVLRSNTSWMNNHYGLPAGKVEFGESFTDGAIREALEEVGVTITRKQLQPVLTIHRNEKGQEPEWVDVFFEAISWKGKLYNAEPNMHSELTWLDPDNLPDNTIPMYKVVFKALKEGKSYIEYGWE